MNVALDFLNSPFNFDLEFAVLDLEFHDLGFQV